MDDSRLQEPPAIRALVVDDDPMMVAVLGRFLRSRGYAVEPCEDGAAALERLRGGDFNLVITDRQMPEMDGLELCRALRALPLPNYVYSIMLTASDDPQALVAAMEAGVDDFAAKPVSLPELGARLHAAERVLTLEAAMARRNQQLADAYVQLRSDLELARTLQLQRLPPPGSFGGVRFDWRYEPSAYVSGDTLDYFQLTDRFLCFHLADVSGHGVAAAMMAFHAQLQLRASSQQLASALEQRRANLSAIAVGVATEYNRRFLQMREDSLYLTMVFGLVDLRAGRAALVLAGHPPPLFAAAAGDPFTAVGTPGVPVGILEDPGYEACELALAPGARLVMYSDGVTDCRDPGDEAFGAERLRGILRAEQASPLGTAADRVHESLRKWRGGAPFEDDVTLLALEAH